MSSKTSSIHYTLTIQDKESRYYEDDCKITFDIDGDKLGITAYYDSCLANNYYALNKSDLVKLMDYLASISDKIKDDKEEEQLS